MYREINQTIKHDIMALSSHVFRYFMCPAEFKSESENLPGIILQFVYSHPILESLSYGESP